MSDLEKTIEEFYVHIITTIRKICSAPPAAIKNPSTDPPDPTMLYATWLSMDPSTLSEEIRALLSQAEQTPDWVGTEPFNEYVLLISGLPPSSQSDSEAAEGTHLNTIVVFIKRYVTNVSILPFETLTARWLEGNPSKDIQAFSLLVDKLDMDTDLPASSAIASLFAHSVYTIRLGILDKMEAVCKSNPNLSPPITHEDLLSIIRIGRIDFVLAGLCCQLVELFLSKNPTPNIEETFDIGITDLKTYPENEYDAEIAMLTAVYKKIQSNPKEIFSNWKNQLPTEDKNHPFIQKLERRLRLIEPYRLPLICSNLEYFIAYDGKNPDDPLVKIVTRFIELKRNSKQSGYAIPLVLSFFNLYTSGDIFAFTNDLAIAELNKITDPSFQELYQPFLQGLLSRRCRPIPCTLSTEEAINLALIRRTEGDSHCALHALQGIVWTDGLYRTADPAGIRSHVFTLIGSIWSEADHSHSKAVEVRELLERQFSEAYAFFSGGQTARNHPSFYSDQRNAKALAPIKKQCESYSRSVNTSNDTLKELRSTLSQSILDYLKTQFTSPPSSETAVSLWMSIENRLPLAYKRELEINDSAIPISARFAIASSDPRFLGYISTELDPILVALVEREATLETLPFCMEVEVYLQIKSNHETQFQTQFRDLITTWLPFYIENMTRVTVTEGKPVSPYLSESEFLMAAHVLGVPVRLITHYRTHDVETFREIASTGEEMTPATVFVLYSGEHFSRLEQVVVAPQPVFGDPKEGHDPQEPPAKRARTQEEPIL